MTQKEFKTNISINCNEKSDTELIDYISNGPGSSEQETAKAILDKRTKKVLQYLTKVIQRNNEVTTKYNNILIWLTI